MRTLSPAQRQDLWPFDRGVSTLRRARQYVWKELKSLKSEDPLPRTAHLRPIERLQGSNSLNPLHEETQSDIPFGIVAEGTSKSEVVKVVAPAMGTRNDVVNGGGINRHSRAAIPASPAKSSRQPKNQSTVAKLQSAVPVVPLFERHNAMIAEEAALLEAFHLLHRLQGERSRDVVQIRYFEGQESIGRLAQVRNGRK